MEIPLLKDLVIILSLAIVVIYLFHLIKIPSIVGFLLTGILLGPHGFGLISDPHEVETLSEIGVILLLFTIGLEFSFRSLLQIKRMALLGGFLQVGLTILLTFIISIAFGQSLEKSLFYGFFVSLSSTAIVMKLIQDKGETDSLHGRNSLGILIFQDLAIIPLMLLVPLLSDQKTEAGGSLLAIAGGLGIVVVVLAGSFWLIPKLLYYIAKTRIRELFLLSVFIICFAIAFLTSSVGLSLALGAFVAGLMISESEYSHQAISHILPFKDIFTSLFFVSIGMLLNTKFMIEYPILILLLTLGVLSLKGFVVALVNVLLGYPIRVALLVAFGLSQVGEFSFLLAKVGMTHKLIDGWIYQIVLAVTVVTMMLTPVLMWLSPYVTNALKAIPCSRWLINRFERGRLEADSSERKKLSDHMIIVGFGVTGRNVARVAKSAGISYIIVEMNPETVRQAKILGEPIYYGDASHETILEEAFCIAARVVIIAIPNYADAERVISAIRRHNKRVHIVVRARYLLHMNDLLKLGASEVIVEEFETSVEIFVRVLLKYLIPQEQIESFVSRVRADNYESFRSPSVKYPEIKDIQSYLRDVEISTFQVSPRCSFVGQRLSDIKLRNNYDVSVLAIGRGEETIPNPPADTVIEADDVAILMGHPENFIDLGPIFLGEKDITVD